MRFRLIRLRFRRRLRKGQKQVEELGTQAEQQIDRHLFRRFGRLAQVRRFVSGWLILVLLLIGGLVTQNILLSGYFQTLQPVPGGIYTEGVLGTFTNANPLYASNDVDTTVSELIFAGLFQYNDQNNLVGDLASGYSVDSKGTTYTVHLKPHLTWQDGQPLTAADVVFTYQTIQNPDAQSPLLTSWQGITISASNNQTVVFKLPDQLASFPYNLTNGIVPQHLLGKIPAADLRSADFNTDAPIGAGPFAWHAIQVSGSDPTNAEEQIGLTPFEHYQAGQPKLQQFVVRADADQQQLVEAFKTGALNGLEGLTQVPKALQPSAKIQTHNLLLTAATMVFFKTSSGILADQKVRQALIEGTNVPQVISSLGYPTKAVREPLLEGQLGFNASLAQAGFNRPAAEALLTADGWLPGSDGVRAKAGQKLTFNLTAADTPEYQLVTKQLQTDWAAIGVKVDLELEDAQSFQGNLVDHSNYDAILYGISIGVDPDVFVYWDSSQNDVRSVNRLNLSEYKNPTADIALESGRTRLNPALRVVKYKPFLQAWQQDAPALGLYQPRLLYITNGSVAGLNDHSLNTATDRFDNVVNWEIRQAKVTD